MLIVTLKYLSNNGIDMRCRNLRSAYTSELEYEDENSYQPSSTTVGYIELIAKSSKGISYHN